LLPLAVASRSTAEELLRTTKAAILIWGEYDAGRVKVNLEVADAQAVDGASLVDRAWERSVSSPAELTPVINTAVPREVQSLALLALGWLARRAGDAALATTLFEEGLALQPETTDTAAALHFYLGALLGTPQGDLAKAIDHYAAALALKPNWPTLGLSLPGHARPGRSARLAVGAGRSEPSDPALAHGRCLLQPGDCLLPTRRRR
jgi:tetratricopeptide (TPR) repeat protein